MVFAQYNYGGYNQQGYGGYGQQGYGAYGQQGYGGAGGGAGGGGVELSNGQAIALLTVVIIVLHVALGFLGMCDYALIESLCLQFCSKC